MPASARKNSLDAAKLEQLLDDNKPAKVAALLKNYKGNDAAIIFTFAEAQRMLGNFEKAILLYNKAIAVSDKQAQDDSVEITSAIDMRLALAKCYRTLGMAQKAQDIASAALSLAAEDSALLDFKMAALQEIGMALRAYGKPDEAATVLKDVLAYYKKQKDYSGISFIYWALGGICRLKGQFKEGIKYFNEAIKLAQKGGDKISLAYGYCGLAGISRIAGDIAGCVGNYKKAEAIFSKTDDIFGKAYTNCGMANGLRQLGKYDEALKRYVVADKLYSSINDTVDLGFVKWGVADVLKRQNKLPQALDYLKKAKKLFASSDEIRGQLLTELALAQVLYALGKRAEAFKIYDAAVARAKAEGMGTFLESYT